MRLALFQPDIPQNVGAAIRAAACFGAGLDIIEPCGFPLDSKKIQRVAMDYGGLVTPIAHAGWPAFLETRFQDRLILLTTKSDTSIWDFDFTPGDVILMGRGKRRRPVGGS